MEKMVIIACFPYIPAEVFTFLSDLMGNEKTFSDMVIVKPCGGISG